MSTKKSPGFGALKISANNPASAIVPPAAPAAEPAIEHAVDRARTSTSCAQNAPASTQRPRRPAADLGIVIPRHQDTKASSEAAGRPAWRSAA